MRGRGAFRRKYSGGGAATVYFPVSQWGHDALTNRFVSALVRLLRQKLQLAREGRQSIRFRGWDVICYIVVPAHASHPGWVDVVGFDCPVTNIRHASLNHVYCREECR